MERDDTPINDRGSLNKRTETGLGQPNFKKSCNQG